MYDQVFKTTKYVAELGLNFELLLMYQVHKGQILGVSAKLSFISHLS